MGEGDWFQVICLNVATAVMVSILTYLLGHSVGRTIRIIDIF